MNKIVTIFLQATVTVLLLLVTVSCKKETATRSADYSTPEAHVVKGTIYGADGKPFHIPNAKVFIEVNGIGASGDNVHYTAQMDADGRYRIQVSDGAYIFEALMNIVLSGYQVNIHLDATDNIPANVGQQSKPGIIKNFQLHLSGLRAGGDANNVYDYYGGHVQLEDGLFWHISGGYFDNLKTRYANATGVVVTLTPQTSLVDGSIGQPITLASNMQNLQTTNDFFVNIPYATYQATAVMVFDNGQTVPIGISVLPDLTPHATVEVVFKPDPSDPRMFPGFPIIELWGQ